MDKMIMGIDKISADGAFILLNLNQDSDIQIYCKPSKGNPTILGKALIKGLKKFGNDKKAFMEYVGAKEFGNLDELRSQGKEPLISKPNLTYMLHQIPGRDDIKLRLEWDYHELGMTLSYFEKVRVKLPDAG